MVLMMGGMNKAIGGSAASIRFSPRAINNHRTHGSSTINTYTPIKTGLKTRSRKRHVHTQIGLFPSHRPDQADRISHVKYPVVMVEDVRPYKDHTLVWKTNGEYLLLLSQKCDRKHIRTKFTYTTELSRVSLSRVLPLRRFVATSPSFQRMALRRISDGNQLLKGTGMFSRDSIREKQYLLVVRHTSDCATFFVVFFFTLPIFLCPRL